MLFYIFTTINTIRHPLNTNGCSCTPSTLDKIEVYYNDESDVEFAVNIKSWENLRKLDLSNNNLTRLTYNFDAAPNLVHLYLNNNNITTYAPRLFNELTNLEVLDLSENYVELFDDSLFRKLKLLKNLNLAKNNLMQITPFMLKNLKNMEILDISYNHFYRMPSDLFKRNKKLRRIYFHDNQKNIRTLPDYFFSNLTKLERVKLNNNDFLSLSEHLFTGSKSLKYINLSDNNLSTLPENIFRGLINLQELLLKDNLITHLPKKIFNGLRKLRKLDISGNRLDFVPKGLFENLNSLKILKMEWNRLRYMEQEALFSLKELKYANFSNNHLELSHPSSKMSPFYKNTLLIELDLSNNKIKTFFTDWTISKNHLSMLNLSYNEITTIATNSFYLLSHNIIVDLSYNKISNILLDDIEDSAVYQTEKRDVTILIDHNPILCDCHLYNFIRYFHNEMPKFVYNYIEIVADNLTCVRNDGTEGPKIQELNSTTYICPEDEYIKIEKRCRINCTCNIKPMDKTRVIDCSYRNMSEISIDQKTINNMEGSPVILNLTGNVFKKIPSMDLFTGLHLTGILLSNNDINQLEPQNLPKNLQVLELHNNNIFSINSKALRYLSSSSLKEFTLSGNPLM
ncbi:hypothetical protein M0802_016515, partial [Mischocyttarus mexicanus]